MIDRRWEAVIYHPSVEGYREYWVLGGDKHIPQQHNKERSALSLELPPPAGDSPSPQTPTHPSSHLWTNMNKESKRNVSYLFVCDVKGGAFILCDKPSWYTLCLRLGWALMCGCRTDVVVAVKQCNAAVLVIWHAFGCVSLLVLQLRPNLLLRFHQLLTCFLLSENQDKYDLTSRIYHQASLLFHKAICTKWALLKNPRPTHFKPKIMVLYMNRSGSEV